MVEVYLRITNENISIYYSGFLYDRELNSLRYKVYFYERNKKKAAWENINHDSYLGWDHNINGGRYRKAEQDEK